MYLKNLAISLIMLTAAMLLFVSSCTKEQVCFIPTTVTAKVLFSIKEARDSTIILVDSNRVIDTTFISYRDTAMAAPALQTFAYDSNFVITGARGSTIVPLSLDPDINTIQYLVIPDYAAPESHDTLTIQYSSHLYFISNDCGFTYNYQIESAHITNHLIDSSAVTDKEVTTEGNKRNIRLFFLSK